MKINKINKRKELKTALTESAKFMARKHLEYKTQNAIFMNLPKETSKLNLKKQENKTMEARRHFQWATDFYFTALNNFKRFENRNK